MVSFNTDGFKRIEKETERKAEEAKEEINRMCKQAIRELDYKFTIAELTMRVARLEGKDRDKKPEQDKRKTTQARKPAPAV